MKSFHPELNQISIQQSKAGRLPHGLRDEIDEAGKLAVDLFKSIDTETILAIDQADIETQPELILRHAREFSSRGLYSRWLPAFVGGGGGHPLAFFGLNLEMGSRCLALSNLLGPHYVALGLVSATQSFHVLKKITAEINEAQARGDLCTAALAVTEPAAGSDMEDVELIEKASVCTKAEKVNGGYKISGQKIFISNSSFSTWIVGSAFADIKKPLDSLIIFAVKTKATGLNIGRTEKKLGQNASPASVLFFDNVFVSDEDICFAPSQFENKTDYLKSAELLLNDLLSLSRAGVGCLAAGAQKRILELVISKSKKTSEWEQAVVAKIARNFVVSKTIAWEGHIECYSRGPYKDLQKESVYRFLKFCPAPLQKLLIAPLLTKSTYLPALRKKRRESLSLSEEKLIFGWGSLTKEFCSERAMESARLALELIGYDGSLESRELDKILRDLKLLEIYEGTNELNLLMIYKNFIGDNNSAVSIFKDE